MMVLRLKLIQERTIDAKVWRMLAEQSLYLSAWKDVYILARRQCLYRDRVASWHYAYGRYGAKHSKRNKRVVFNHNIKSVEKKMSEVKELLKPAADSMKNRTLNELLENDTEYQKHLKEEKEPLKAV